MNKITFTAKYLLMKDLLSISTIAEVLKGVSLNL
jgi:hypothetical protein